MSEHKLVPVSWTELVCKLKSLGFEGPYHGGKHPYMIKGSFVLTIPKPHLTEISVELLVRIIRQIGISRDEWIEK